MSYILHIETATKNCSVAIAKNGVCIAVQEIVDLNYSHAEKLHPFITTVLQESNIEPKALNAIAVSKGPGSYTGLRIGVSAAKGLCYAFNIPLIATDTLGALAKAIAIEQGRIVPMLDARRMEVYSAIYTADYNLERAVEAQIITATSFEKELAEGPVYFVGDGAEKCNTVITHPNAVFVANTYPSALQMVTPAFEKFKSQEFEDVAYFEPFYLKDFVATQQKQKTSPLSRN